MSYDNILDNSKKLYNQILESKFDADQFQEIYAKISEQISPLDTKLTELTIELEKVRNVRDQLIKYKDATKQKIISEINLITEKMRNITGTEEESDSEESEESNIENTSSSYLDIAKTSISETESQKEPQKSKFKIDYVKITQKISIPAIYCTSNNVLNAPVGNLLWLVDKTQFVMKVLVGDKPVIFEGNVGNIYVRGDNVSNVDLCRNSKIGRTCIKNECTFRHEPPKKGEIRNWFSAPTYYPPQMDFLSREHKGVHRIGSREHLDKDLIKIKANESHYEYSSYISQAFHSFLVSLIMEKGIFTSS